MKLIVAVVKPFKAEEIADAFEGDPHFPGMTVLDARGFGRERQHPPPPNAPQWLEDLVPHRIVLVAAPDHAAERLARRIRDVAHTGRPGDGKVFVLDLVTALAITTGEEGEAALE